ncbi:sulfite exporter TauE/SafE family protein [Thiohalorhabdus sp.]|uniref:sulfite exporter TauE/SafE family protein n=1 Tax=Thiohalorhabdus sp. TaxID=3094134 RepID=UPI002FC3D286
MIPDLPLTFGEWLLASLVLVGGAVVQGSVGFGVALLGAPLLFLLNPALVPAPMLIAGLTLPALILVRDRAGLEKAPLAWALPGFVVGSALAGGVVTSLPEGGLALAFGGLVLLAVALSALGWAAAEPQGGHLAAAGTLAGFMATATSIGGPPLALVFQNAGGLRLRATLSAIFVPGGLMALLSLATVGRFDGEALVLGLALLPAVLAGFWLSGYTARTLDRAWLRPVVLAVSALAGAGAVVRGLV